jgi:hypothetical protein
MTGTLETLFAVSPELVQDVDMPAQEVQWSDLARDPKSVAALADTGDVRLKRRDGADLVLTRADRIAAADEGAVTAARAFRNVLTHIGVDALARPFLDEFPWVQVLPEEDVGQFIKDFVRSAQAAAELGRWELLTEVIREWKATARIYTEPGLADRLSAPVDRDFGPVSSPFRE